MRFIYTVLFSVFLCVFTLNVCAFDLKSSFTPREGYRDALGSIQYYQTSNAIITNEITLKLENLSEIKKCGKKACVFSSGMVDTYGKWSTGAAPKGMLVIDATLNSKTEHAQGLWPAIWMLPNSNEPFKETKGSFPWPLNGEIDIIEGRGSDFSQVSSSIHYGLDDNRNHEFNSSVYKNSLFNITNRNSYAFSWDFTDESAPQLWWFIKSNSSQWKIIKKLNLSKLGDDERRTIYCPEVSKKHPRIFNLTTNDCFLRIFQAGASSKHKNEGPLFGYYLIISLAVATDYDGEPNNGLVGSTFTIHNIEFFPNETHP